MKVIITAAGTGTAFSYATATAKNFPEIKLYTADTNPGKLVTSSLYSEKHFQTKSIYDTSYYNDLSEIIEINEIDYYIPLIDEEVINAYSHSLLKNKILANSLEFCKSCIEKNNYEKSFSLEGLHFPKIIRRSDVVNYENYIVKKNGGFGGRGTRKINGSEVHKLDESFITYEFISGNEITIDCIPFNGSTVTSIRIRAEIKNGVCTKAKIIRNEILESAADLICQKYNLTHPFCFQVIEKNNKFYLIDFNPRLGAGSAMSAVNGLDFFSAHLAMIIGKSSDKYLNRHHESCIVTRQYANYLTRVL